MNTRLARIALAAGTLVTGLLVAAPAATAATTFTVTSSSCSGAGSWQAAIQAANAHPGTDIIDVQTDMADLYVGNCAGTSVPGNIFAGHITDSVTINGNGHVMRGDPTWVASDGTLNPNGACPSKVHGTILLDTPAAAFEVGVKNSDNSAVSVAVNDLTVQGANSLLLVRDNAHVALDGVHAKGLTDLLCSRPAIESQTGASLSINNSSFDSGINWEPALNGVGSSLILGGPGSLSIHRTTFTNNTYPGAITWDVSGGKIANIVSSQLSTSGGIMVLGDGSANMVNSIVDMGSLGSRDVTDRVVADSGAIVTLTASTVKASGALCQSSPIIGGCAVTPDGYLVAAGGGSLHLVQSAVGTGVTDDTAASAVVAGSDGGSFTADASTWILPVLKQGATALQTLFAQPSLLTGTPGLPTVADPGFFDYPSTVTPMLGSPGVLLDVIPDSTCTSGTDTNKLINPIDSTCITEDALGNPRWDSGNDRRNSGAVQLTLAPRLAIVGSGSHFLDLSWSRPNDPSNVNPVTGYSVTCTPVGGGTPMTVTFTGATTLTGRVSGLTNGVAYSCVVASTSTGGTGPASNAVVGTPYGPVGTPVVSAASGPQRVTVSWTVPSSGGHPGSPTYSVLFRVRGATAWTPGPGSLSGRTTVIPSLVNGTTYQFGVFATWPDGTISPLGVTTAMPSGPLPLTISAHSTAVHPSRWRATTLIVGSSTNSYGTVLRSVRCAPTRTTRAGDLRYCTYRVGPGGSVTVTPQGWAPVRIVITLQAVPKAGVKGWTASAAWQRTWTSR